MGILKYSKKSACYLRKGKEYIKSITNYLIILN